MRQAEQADHDGVDSGIDEVRATRAKALQRHEVIVSAPDSLPRLANAYHARLPINEWAAMRAWFTTFYPFQLRWLLEPARRAACVKARQIGWSHTTAANAVIWGAYHGELTTIISKGQKESTEVLEKAKRHARVLTALGSDFATPIRSNTEEIEFPSGGKIMALPSSGGRSFTGNVILDEYAYQQNQKNVWDAAAAVTMLGSFRLRVISTPNGTGDGFHELIDGIETKATKGYGLHKIAIEDAIREGYPVNIEECWALAKGDPRLFAQLFQGSFLDGELQYIPSDDVAACATETIERFSSKHAGYGFFGGLDIGETHDRTVLIVVFMDHTGKRWVQWQRSCRRTNYVELENIVAEAFRTFSLRKLCLDTTGLGTFEGQRLQAQYGELAVEGVKFSEASKEAMANHLYTAFTKRLIAVGKHDGSVLDQRGKPALPPGAAKEIMDDVCKLKRIITSAGNVRYDAPRTAAGHADNAWALGLALEACNRPLAQRRDTRNLVL